MSTKLDCYNEKNSKDSSIGHVTIHCNNYIGFSFVGHWDENIVENIKIEQEGDLIVSSIQEINKIYGDPPIPLLGGGLKRIDCLWHQFSIKLIDGNVIKVACESFEIEEKNNSFL